MTNNIEQTDGPGIVARNYMNRLSDNGYLRHKVPLDFKNLQTGLIGGFYDDVIAQMDICIKNDISPEETVSLWTDGSIVKDENAIAGVGVVGLNKRNEVILTGSISITASDKGLDIYDVETIGVLIGIRLSDDFRVDNIYCDNKSVVQTIDTALKERKYPLNAVWTKGHADDLCNNLADGLAKHGRHKAKRENLLTGKPLNLRYVPGNTNKRTGWKEIQAKGFDKPMIFKEDCLSFHDESPNNIEHVYVWERISTSIRKGLSSQYIIAHCDKDHNVLSVRRGLIHNPDLHSGRYLNSEFIASRLPDNTTAFKLHMSNFMSSRYQREIHMPDDSGRWSQEYFQQKMLSYGYYSDDIIHEKSISNNLFTNIMNKSYTIAMSTIQNLIAEGLEEIETSKKITQNFQNEYIQTFNINESNETSQPFYYSKQENDDQPGMNFDW